MAGTSSEFHAINPKFKKKMQKLWKDKLGWRFGMDMHEATRKAIGNPNVVGQETTFKTGSKAGKLRVVRYRKTRPTGKAVISRKPDSYGVTFRQMNGGKLPSFQIGDMTIDVGFMGHKGGEVTRQQEEGFLSERVVWKKGAPPKKLNARNIKKSKIKEMKKHWENMPKVASMWVDRINSSQVMKWTRYYRSWGYDTHPSMKDTYHPTLSIGMERTKRKFPRTMRKYIKANINDLIEIKVE